MEVAAHCLTHADLTAIPPQCCVYEITEDKKNIEDMFGKICRGMAYPFGTVNDAVEACVRSSGILYSRTVRSTHNFSIEGNWLRLGTTCHHNDRELDALVNRFLELDVKFSPQLFYLWGHSFEFNINDNWNVIENFCSKIVNKNDTWYATNIEIFEYTEAYRRLVSNTKGTDVYNPNCISVWISDLKGEVKKIHPGERIKI